MQQLGKEMTRLLRTCNVVGFVLHPHTTRHGEPERIRQCVGTRKRREHETDSRYRSNLGVEFVDERIPIGLAHAMSVGECIPREIPTKRNERIRVFRASQWRDVAFDQQYVMSIVFNGIRTTPGKRRIDRHAGAASGTSQAPNDWWCRLWIGAQHVNQRRGD
ncbi:MAG: hypothetical protein RL643_211, partial [Actinomycetota bacterium]